MEFHKVIRFIIMGIMLAAPPAYMTVCIVIAVSMFAATALRDYAINFLTQPAEQDYHVVVGYIIKNGKAVPKKVYYIEGEKRIPVPEKNVKIQALSDDVYEANIRIKRHDGDGYDYAAARLKRVSDTEFKTVRTVVGKEM